ncbi:MAG: response regulator transcription factor [Acidobacteria bacterium]|nr:response regulator transcription factor [Acidobacteriota bacterium]
MRILLVEDEVRVAHFIAKGLGENAYAVDVTAHGDEALYWAGANQYDFIILDVMIPGRDGFAVCRELRRRGIRAPVLMLTARDAVEDRVTGLDCGADDYLIKPFDFKELLARLRALARRAEVLRPAALRVADLELDTASHRATRGGRAITLTAKEYALLEFLMLNENRVVDRDRIARHVWDESFDPLSNTIDVHIRRLRGKIDAGAAEPLIHTRRGEGYVLCAGGPGA